MNKKEITEVEISFVDIKNLIVGMLTEKGIRKPNESVIFDETHCRILINAKVYHEEK